MNIEIEVPEQSFKERFLAAGVAPDQILGQLEDAVRFLDAFFAENTDGPAKKTTAA